MEVKAVNVDHSFGNRILVCHSDHYFVRSSEISSVIGAHDFSKQMNLCVFEGNNRSIQLAETPKASPSTKHIDIKHNHFRTFVEKGVVILELIGTSEQKANFLTKPLAKPLFRNLQFKFMG